jgi:hypothetical protein
MTTNALRLAVLMALAGCSAPSMAGGAEQVVHRDPRGFEIRTPTGWTIAPDRRTSRVEIAAVGGGRLLIWPLFSQTDVDEVAVLRHLAGRLWPGIQWRGETDAPLLRATDDTRWIAVTLAVNRSPQGAAIVLYGIEAPKTRFAAVARAAPAVFASARFTGPATPGAPRGDALTFVPWRDPREGAFSLDIPKGWQVRGGAFRFAGVDVRPLVEVRSPDGRVTVRIGDPELPTFAEPMPFFPEGSAYSPGYGVQMQVRRLPAPRLFVTEYVRSRVAQGCGDLQVVEARDRADAVRQVNAIYRQYGLPARMLAGDTTFTCRQASVEMRGYYFAGLQVTQMGGPALWKAENLLGYLASADRSAQAQQVLSRIMGSFAVDARWMAMQQGINASTAQIVRQTGDAISKLITDSYWSKQPGESEISRRRSNAMLGIEDVTDTHGNTFRVESGANHYWINPRGTIVGTEIDAVPRGDFKRLVIY